MRVLADRLGFAMATISLTRLERSEILGADKKVTKTLEELYIEALKNAKASSEMAGAGPGGDEAESPSGNDRATGNLIISG